MRRYYAHPRSVVHSLRLSAAAVAVASLLACGAGCQTAPPVDPPDAATPSEADSTGGAVRSTRDLPSLFPTSAEDGDASSDGPAASLIGVVVQPGRLTYTLREDDVADAGKLKTVHAVVRRAAGEPFPWRRHQPDDRIEHIGVTDDGGVALGAVDDLDWGVTNWFDPPVPLAPANVQPGQTRRYESKVAVSAMGKPDAVRDRGVYKLTLTRKPDVPVVTPAGTFTCRHYVRDQTIDLGMADVVTRSELWYARGIGLVRQVSRENVKAIIVSWTNNRELKLIRYEPGEGVEPK